MQRCVHRSVELIDERPAIVDWTVPDHDLDGLYGDGATRAERALPRATGALALAGVLAHSLIAGLDWTWWQYLIAGALVLDLVGGIVAMALNSAKRFHHAQSLPVPRRSAALTRNAWLFTAVHVQPIVIGVLFGGPWWWGPAWYALCLAGLFIVTRVPLYLARPVAMLLLALTAVLSPMVEHPPGFAWVPMVLVAKLVLGAVREEPYRPTPSR